MHATGPSLPANDFPVVALFASHPDRTLLSPSIRSRLYVSMTDPDWKERIKSTAESRGLQLNQGEVSVYEVRVHPLDLGEQHYAIEFRPRAGTWSPFFVAIPLGEKEVVGPRFSYGPRNQPIIRSGPISYAPGNFQMYMQWVDSQWWYESAANEASPTQSYFVLCSQLPSVLEFGVSNGPRYRVVRQGAEYRSA